MGVNLNFFDGYVIILDDKNCLFDDVSILIFFMLSN